MILLSTLYKTFSTYTEVLYYTIAVEDELNRHKVHYDCEVSFRELLNDYKVIYKIWGQ